MKRKKERQKKTIAILLALALILGIVSYTQLKISAEIDPVQIVYAKQEIPPRTEITADMISTREVSSKAVPPNAITDPNKVIGKWTVTGYGVPKNSFMYDEKILKKENLPDSAILNLQKDEVALPLLVDLETSLGNSIIPNTKVDLYFRSKKDNSTTDDKKVLYGKLATNVRVVSVKDNQASNVFQTEGKEEEEENASSSNQPSLASIYIFAVPQELNELLNKAKLVGDVVPVATSEAYSVSKDEEQLTNEEVLQFIEGTYQQNEEGENEE
ncbi:RcpC/CpaB family pilus assembly protein [Exiguobacterium sp. BG5(2022)]|uniref:RcpC/CpaB family pilus assembly protein n=1 Tax=Exiguobacterium sp. BG5(2022) TaxID=2962595 RepID=UPI0028823A45|nr:RcpC/CpaB family pilus assembly protein [Exiguobacterium sp. BG5(2022)]MDT0193707.1 RcpC/CpaB family pilus assembly protein [Exiguobacterium sp. BG5(2022)]